MSTERLVVGHGGVPLLPALDLQLHGGEFWAIAGRNGSGKTTLLRTVLGLLPPVSGDIRFAPGVRAAFVPQRTALDPIVPLRARDVVAMGLERGWSVLRPLPRGRRHRVHDALAEVGAGALAAAHFRDLSEGQKQRVLLARALAAEPDVIFLDEPTAAMDIVAERETLDLIRQLRDRRGMAVVIVSHYLALIAEYAERMLFIDRETGTALGGTPPEVFATPAFRQRYGDVEPGGGR